jgi:chromosome segregation ATPase
MKLTRKLKALQRAKSDHSVRISTLQEISNHLHEERWASSKAVEEYEKKIESLNKYLNKHGDCEMTIPSICSFCGIVWDAYVRMKPCICEDTWR